MAPALPLTDRAGSDVLFRLPGRDVAAASFAADALRLAASIPPGGHVANLCTGRYAFAVAFAAALLAGRTSLLTSDRSPGRLSALAARFPGLAALTDDAEACPVPAVRVPPPGTEAAPIPAIPADRLAALVFTSGSTGEPAIHPKPWGVLVERSRAAAEAFALAGPAALVATVPPQHMYGFETSVLLPLHAPCAAWCGPAFYPADIRAALEASQAPRWLVTTPLQLRTLLLADAALPPLAGIISATAPLDPAMAREAESRWSAPVHEIYGATEAGSIAHRRTTAGETWTPYRAITLAPAESGTLVRCAGAGPVVLDDAIETLPGGRFRLLGRSSDVIKLGGRRASLAGLNRALTAIAGVQDGVFIPPLDGEHGPAARMTALVVAPGADPATILDALRGSIDPLFLPRRIVQVERLPRNELGKLPAAAARALAAQGPARAAP